MNFNPRNIVMAAALCTSFSALAAPAPPAEHKPPRFVILDYTGVALSRDTSFDLSLFPIWGPHQRLIVGPTFGLHGSGRSQVELEAALDLTPHPSRVFLINAAAGTLLDQKGTVWTVSSTIYYVFTPYYRQYRVDGVSEIEVGLKIKLPIIFLAAIASIGGR